MSYLLINADDFGLTTGVTEGIVLCGARGLPLSTSVMPCLASGPDLVGSAAKRFAGGIGLHLQLTQGVPVLPATEVVSLVDAEGRFPLRRLAKAPDIKETAAEWRAQFSRVRSWGVEPDHLDSHHHVHGRSELGLLPVFASLAEETGLPARSGSRAEASFLRQRDIACPDVVISLSELNGEFERLIAALELERSEGPPDLVVEIMCHPGLADVELADVSRYVACRERELRLLLEPDTFTALEKRGWSIIRYNELQGLRNW